MHDRSCWPWQNSFVRVNGSRGEATMVIRVQILNAELLPTAGRRWVLLLVIRVAKVTRKLEVVVDGMTRCGDMRRLGRHQSERNLESS